MTAKPAAEPGTTGAETKPRRRTQEERSNATRQLLLDATVECLIDLGYAGTTTTVIADRAGVSRGAQLHHYPTKAELVAAAVEHLGEKLGSEIARDALELRSHPDRLSGAIDVLWARYGSPFFHAWLELWVAARTDAELRSEIRPLEDRLRLAVIRQIRELFGEEDQNGPLDEALVLTMFLLQGMAVDRALTTGDSQEWRANDEAVLKLWKRTVHLLMAEGNGRPRRRVRK